ncbi:MAG: type II secretion system protein [Armatimonadetes bacterium]|nr:type II secretion system protein [Armatimonadota bacterium]
MKKRIVAKHNSGFTLIELLVVMAISVILMYLVMQPIIESFRMTRGAQAMVDAQDSARRAMEQISREIGESMDVLDYGTTSTLGSDCIELPVRNLTTNAAYWLPMSYAKIDLAMPKMIAHCNNPDHDPTEPRDFEQPDEDAPACPVCGLRDVIIRPKLPLEQSNIVVRYFLGLRYNDPNPDPATDTPAYFGWQSPWGDNVEANAGNQVVLYRIEFDPNDASIFGADKTAAAIKLVDVLKDPQFFYSDEEVPGTLGTQNHMKFWQVWAEKARVVGLDKYVDLVSGAVNGTTGLYQSLTPSVSFRFAKVDKDPFVGTNYSDSSSDSPDSMPTAFRSKFGYWTPNTYAGITGQYGIQVYRYDTSSGALVISSYRTGISGSGGNLVVETWVDNVISTAPVFDITQYMTDKQINLASINANTQMAYFFDFADNALNFNRGTVNFALSVEPCILTPDDLFDINNHFNIALEDDRGTAARMFTLDACITLRYATIVPGSDVLTGPNMVVGAGYGQPIRYERVPLNLGDPQFNQYKIDYRTGNVYFSRVPDQKLPDSDDNPIPSGLRVDYKIQFNKNGDVVQGDYQTKAMINLHIGIRMYDPEAPAKPRVVDLNNTVKVRNAYR